MMIMLIETEEERRSFARLYEDTHRRLLFAGTVYDVK